MGHLKWGQSRVSNTNLVLNTNLFRFLSVTLFPLLRSMCVCRFYWLYFMRLLSVNRFGSNQRRHEHHRDLVANIVIFSIPLSLLMMMMMMMMWCEKKTTACKMTPKYLPELSLCLRREIQSTWMGYWKQHEVLIVSWSKKKRLQALSWNAHHVSSLNSEVSAVRSQQWAIERTAGIVCLFLMAFFTTPVKTAVTTQDLQKNDCYEKRKIYLNKFLWFKSCTAYTYFCIHASMYTILCSCCDMQREWWRQWIVQRNER